MTRLKASRLLFSTFSLGVASPAEPKGLPIVGNLFNRPLYYAWLTYTRWGSVHGEIVSYTVFGHPVVVVNSARVANELFEKRSNIYSDRPCESTSFVCGHIPDVPIALAFNMAAGLMKWAWNLALMPYSDKWR